ncbi:COG1 [Acanthosepion pharaonis]|uniref:Conserved oligomeric Golgi complex subunit 1 n=1 Tax=Acanthosepion pharaonis TaxID=158019 RepID=A0A812D4T3_ACAPH|nr:COG1 [Sepia pharaonis]
MASEGAIRNLPLHEMDTNLMFEKFTIQEIREIEKKNRVDIERKKEELRVMVGERYRDLIEAADTITEMKNSSQNVMKSISRMEELCKQLKQNHMVKGASYTHRPFADKASLQLEAQQSASILSWFPVLSRQWTAISHFKATILQGCRKLLRDVTATDKQIADALCSILLLEDSTPRQVFNEFLLARTNAVQQLFHVSQQGIGVKQQICLVVQLIVRTVHQIHAVFYTAENDTLNIDTNVPCNLLYSILEKVTNTSLKSVGLLDHQSSISARYLPNSVIDFRPTTRASISVISVQHLKENCQQWIDACIQSVKIGMCKLLGFVNTVKRLADIRKEVWELLLQETNFDQWKLICERIFNSGQLMSIWSVFLKEQFLDRIKSLIQFQMDSTAEVTKRHISKVVMELASPNERSMMAEVDLANFIWIESVGDIPTNTAWIPASQKTLNEGGGLLMKARTFTPAVLCLCKTFNDKLKSMLEDIEPYLTTEENVTLTSQQHSPFDQLADCPEIEAHVKKSSENCVTQILDYVTEQMKLWKKSLEEIQDKTTNEITINKVILVGRFCLAVTDLCPHLHKCIVGMDNKEKGIKSSGYKSKKATSDSLWENVQASLSQCHLDSYGIWTNYTSSMIITQIRQAILNQEGSHIISSLTKWDEIDIEEETESGEKIKSKIRVPMQASWYVQTLLYSVCKEINRVAGHAVKRQVLLEMVSRISDGIVECYEQLLQKSQLKSSPPEPGCIHLTQQRALQHLFDIKFITSVIPAQDMDDENKGAYQQRIKQIFDQLEEFVDPFDLDVFTPYMQSHLTKCSQRCNVLFGSMTSVSKQNIIFGNRHYTSGSHHQEQHNILPLSNCTNRFPLLPLSTSYPNRAVAPQPVLQALPRTEIVSSSLAEVAAAVLPKPTVHNVSGGSFYDKLGSVGAMWFSNIGGGGSNSNKS